MTMRKKWKRAKANSKAQATGRSLDPFVRRKNALYRAGLSCAIGRDAIEGRIEIPANVSPMEWAMINLLHAVEEIASAIEPNPKLTVPRLGADTVGRVVR